MPQRRGGREGELDAKGAKLANSLRAQVAAAAPDHADIVIESLVEAVKTQKRVKGRCEKCNAWVDVTVQDSTAAVNAIKVLIEQAEGRPGVAGEGDSEKVRIVRWVAPDPSLLDLPSWQKLAEQGDLASLGELRDAILAAGHEVELYGSG